MVDHSDESYLRRKRAQARLGAELARRGDESGHGLRRRALRAIRRRRRAQWRAIVAERIALGYRDLGGEGGES